MFLSGLDQSGSFRYEYVFCVADGSRIFRSSVAAFYPWLLKFLYRFARRSHRDCIIPLRLLLHVQSEIEEVVYWMSKILFAAEIVLSRLYRSMSQQELNLLQFTAAIMAQLRACSPQIMRGNVLQSGFFAAGSDDVPDNILRDTIAPYLSQSGHGSKDLAVTDPSGACPLIEGGFDPCGNGHRANVATFTD